MILEAFVLIAVVCVCYWYTSSPRYRIGNFPKPPGYFLIGHAPYINSSKKLLPYLHKHLDKFDGLMQIYVGTEVMLTASNYKFVEWLMTSTTIISKSLQYSFFYEWLGRALLIATGSHWKSKRKILTPAFHFKRIENLISVCQKAGDILIHKMANNLGKEYFDVYPLISNYSLDVICESSMATSINAQEEVSEYRSCIQSLCQIILERAFDPLYMHDFIFFFHPQYQNFHKLIKTIHKFDQTVIEKRRKFLQNPQKEEKNDGDIENVYGEKKRTPFLDILLKARDGNGDPLSNKDIRDEVDGIMFAGHDTTASAISFVLYNLSTNPDVQEKVFNEQSEIFSQKTYSQITYADLNGMKYLEMVIKESLRIYTPIPFVARKLEEDTYYGQNFFFSNL